MASVVKCARVTTAALADDRVKVDIPWTEFPEGERFLRVDPVVAHNRTIEWFDGETRRSNILRTVFETGTWEGLSGYDKAEYREKHLRRIANRMARELMHSELHDHTGDPFGCPSTMSGAVELLGREPVDSDVLIIRYVRSPRWMLSDERWAFAMDITLEAREVA